MNNIAELTSLLWAAEAAAQICRKEQWGVKFVADSKLIVDFCARSARPSKPNLFAALAELNVCLHQLRGNYSITHIPREQNSLADWLSKVGLLSVEGDVTPLCSWMSPSSAPLLPLTIA